MADNNRETLGRRICRLRLQHGMTQERLANVANVSAQAVSKWENDQSYPDITLLPLLARTFGVTVDELLGAEAGTTEREAAEKPAREPQVGPDTTSAPESELEPQTELKAAPAKEPASEAGDEAPDDEAAAHIRVRVVREGREAVNLAVPLAAARLLANVTAYFPDRLVEGVDLASLVEGVKGAGTGTLVDIDDGADRVTITLE